MFEFHGLRGEDLCWHSLSPSYYIMFQVSILRNFCIVESGVQIIVHIYSKSSGIRNLEIVERSSTVD